MKKLEVCSVDGARVMTTNNLLEAIRSCDQEPGHAMVRTRRRLDVLYSNQYGPATEAVASFLRSGR